MKLDSLRRNFVRELDDFYDAVGRLQEGLQQMAKTECAAELLPGFVRYLEQMWDLGHRLERMFSLVNGQSLQNVCRSLSDVSGELQAVIELEHSKAALIGKPDERGGPSGQGRQMEKTKSGSAGNSVVDH